jgi:hypothetical protein
MSIFMFILCSLKFMCLLKLLLNKKSIMIYYKSNCNFKNHINFGEYKIDRMVNVYN